MTSIEPMDAEFDTVAEWTAEVIESLGPQYRMPAACRGSGRPSALDWLLAGLAPRPGDLMIDIGAGLGGPAGNGFGAEPPDQGAAEVWRAGFPGHPAAPAGPRRPCFTGRG